MDVTKVLRAESVALGMEVAGGRKSRTAEWGKAANPTLPMSNVLDDMSDERLAEMEQQVLTNMRGDRR